MRWAADYSEVHRMTHASAVSGERFLLQTPSITGSSHAEELTGDVALRGRSAFMLDFSYSSTVLPDSSFEVLNWSDDQRSLLPRDREILG